MSNKLHVHFKDMEPEMLEHAQKVIVETIETEKEEKRIANRIRTEFDKNKDGSWNCIVGKNFGSHVIHQTKGYLFVTFNDEISILLWKSGWASGMFNKVRLLCNCYLRAARAGITDAGGVP